MAVLWAEMQVVVMVASSAKLRADAYLTVNGKQSGGCWEVVGSITTRLCKGAWSGEQLAASWGSVQA